MIDLTKLQPAEAERIAYAEGFTMAAELFARIAELEAERDALAQEVEDARTDSLTDWERKNGSGYDYVQFFQDCFARLAGHYPAPDISSDYDKSVIFAAIEKGEEVDANGGAV
jgi:hypothetical protein